MVHLPSGGKKAGIAHIHADVIYALPVAPGFFRAFSKLDKVSCPRLLRRLPIEDKSNANGVGETPKESIEYKECLVEWSGRSEKGKEEEICMEKEDRYVNDTMQISVM